MGSRHSTEAQLIEEVERLKQRVAELEAQNTAYQQAQDALSEDERNLRAFFNTIDHLLFVLDSQGNIMLTNETVSRKLGYSAEEMLGQSVLMVHPPERREEAGRIVMEMLAGKADYCPVPLLTKDGGQIPVETRVVAGKWSGQNVIFGVTKDLSEIKASEEKFSKAFQSSPALMAISEVETGCYIDVNDAFLNGLGYTRDEVISERSSTLNLFVDPEQRDRAMEIMRREGRLKDFEVLIRAKSGEIRYGFFSAEFIQLQDRKLLLTMMNDITARVKAEEGLRVSEAHYHALVDASPDAIVLCDREGTVLTCNGQTAALHGYEDAGQIQGLNIANLIAPEALDLVQKEILRFAAHGERKPIECVLLRKDGSRFTGELSVSVVFDRDGKIDKVVGISRDISPRKHSEEQMRRWEEIFKRAGWGVTVGSADGKVFELMNPAYARMHGYTVEELIGKPVATVFSPEERTSLPEHIREAHERGNLIWEAMHIRKDGSRFPALMNVTAVRDEQGQIIYRVVYAQDITERKRMESELKRWADIFENTEWGILVDSADGARIELANPACARMHGYSVEEITGLSMLKIFAPEDWGELSRNIQLAHEKGHHFWEAFHVRKDGSRFPVQMDITAVRDEQGNILYRVVNVQDITERKKAEEALRQSEEKYRSVVNSLSEGILLRDQNGLVIASNRAASQILGLSGEEMLGSRATETTWQSIHEDGSLYEDEDFPAIYSLRTGQPLENMVMGLQKRDGVVWLSVNSQPICLSGREKPDFVVTSFVDITGRKLAEEALRQSREMYRLLAENVSDVVWILDMETGYYRYISPSVEWLRGYTPEEAMTQRQEEILTPETLQAVRKKVPARMEAFRQGKMSNYTDIVEQYCKDGSTVWVEGTISYHQNEVNNHLEIYGISRDITERKHNEALLQLRMDLFEYGADHSLDAFMQTALDKICQFTQSPIGFFHFVEPDQKTLSLQIWSTQTARDFCKTIEKGVHYPIDKAGVWADSLRQRKPIIHNDYPALPYKKGLPEGHASLTRELVVPIFQGSKAVAVIGVGNRPANYTERDAQSITYLLDVLWETIQRKQAEQSLNEMESRLRLVSDNLEDTGLYVYSYDSQGVPHFEYISAGIERLTGVKMEDAQRDALLVLAGFLPEYQLRMAELESKSQEHLSNFEIEARYKHAITGEIRWVLIRSTPRRRADGSIVWYGVQMDITRRKRSDKLLEEANDKLRRHVDEIELLQGELREQAIRDPLTGLYNRRYLSETLNRELARMDREGKPLSILMMDIDNFKIINDTYGHLTGDRFLVILAQELVRRSRKSDIAVRFGGDEFLLALPGATTQDARARAEELRRACEKISVKYGLHTLKISISIGIATYPAHANQPQEIYAKADRALYQSKLAGRNQTTIWQEAPS